MNRGNTVAKINSDYIQQYDTLKERQKRKKKRLYRRLTFFAMVIVLSFGSLFAYHLQQRSIHAQKQEQYIGLQEQMEQLKNNEKRLNEEIQLLNDVEYVLQIARTDYFFTKEGEIVFKLPQEKPSY